MNRSVFKMGRTLNQPKKSFALNRIASAQMALFMGVTAGVLCTPTTYAEDTTSAVEIQRKDRQSSNTNQQSNKQAHQLPALSSTALHDGVYAGGQVAKKSQLGFLGDKDFMETPFNTVSYTAKYIEDQQAQDVSQVIAATDPSIFTTGASGVIAESYAIRGFTNGTSASSKDSSFNGLYGIAPFYRTSPEMFERIEVLKGPTALLNGMPPGGTVGGAINLVSKRAGDEPLTRLTTTYMSNSQFGGHIDIGRRFGTDKEFGVRVNGVYRDGEGAIKDQDKKAHLFSLGADWRGQRSRLSADFYLSEDSVDGSNRGINLAQGITLPKAPNPKTLLNPSWTFFETKDRGGLVRAEYDLTDHWMAYATAGMSKTHYKTQSVGSATLLNNQGDLQTKVADLAFEYEKKSAEIGLKGQVNTGALKHAIVFNATHYNDEDKEFARRINSSWVTNIYNPVWDGAPDRFDPSMAISKTKTRLNSYGVADTLSFADDKLQLTLGVRRQEVVSEAYNPTTGVRNTRYDKGANTPAVALLFKINPMLSVYANYIEGLSQGGTAPTNTINEGQMFAPYKTKQKEIGLKIDAGQFANTLSVYEIKKPSAYSITNADPNILPLYVVGGEQRNRGVEWEFFGEIMQGLRLMGGMTYIDPKLTKTQDEKNKGNIAAGVPKAQAKLGIEGDIPAISGLTLTANINAASKQYLDIENTVSVPGRTIYAIGARYTTQVAKHPMTLRAGVENLTNKAYWAMPQFSNLILGAPRTYLLSASFDF